MLSTNTTDTYIKKIIKKKIVWLCYKNLSKKRKEKKLCYKIYSEILT